MIVRPDVVNGVVALFGHDQVVRCWPWETPRFFAMNDGFRTEETSDSIEIRGSISVGGVITRWAVAHLSGKVLLAYKRTGQKGFLVDAVRVVVEELAELLHTRPAYTPPPKGWRKFGRVRR